MADYDEDVALFSKPQSTYTGEVDDYPPRRLQYSSEDEDQDDDVDEDPHVGRRTQVDPAATRGTQTDLHQGRRGNLDEVEEPCAIPPYDEVLSNVHMRAMEEAGFGRLQWLLFVVLGLGLMGDGIELLMIAYVLPGAEKDLCMDDEKKGWLGAIAFAGMMFGAVIWGNLSDKVGRKPTLITSLSVNALFAIVGAFVPSYWMFLLCRFLSGLGIGGSIPIVMAYGGEFCQAKGRGLRLGMLLMFWVTGGVYVSALGWLIIPNEDLALWVGEETRFNSWRTFILICIIPVLMSICGLCFMPESPRFLLDAGRDLDALSVYRKLYTWNHAEAGAEYEMPEIELPSQHIARPVEDLSMGFCEGFIKAFENFWNSFFQLFYKPLTVTTVVLCCTWFSTAFGYYGLSIWFPEYIKRLEQEAYFAQTNITKNTSFHDLEVTGVLDNIYYDNVRFTNVNFTQLQLRHVTFDMCEFTQCIFQNVSSKKSVFFESSVSQTTFNDTDFYGYKFKGTEFEVGTMFNNTREGCQVDFDISYSSRQVFLENFLSQLVVIPAALISALIIDKVGRVRLLVSCLLVSAISVFFIWFTNTEVAVVCLNALFNCFINGAFNAIDVTSTEQYPTHLRSTAFGFQSCLGRIAAILGNVAFGNFLGVSKAIPILLTSAILVLGAIVSLKLPESKDKML